MSGVTVIELKVKADDTVKVALPVLIPEVAVMIEVPLVKPVAMPVGKTVATAMVPDDHVTELVMTAVVPSV